MALSIKTKDTHRIRALNQIVRRFSLSQWALEKRFGLMAVEKGYITQDQLLEAVTIQVKETLNGFEPKLIVHILLEMGCCNAHQINRVLESMGFPIEFCRKHMN